MGGLGVCDEKSGIIRLDTPAVQNGMSSVIASFDCARLRLSVLQGLRLLLGSFCRSWVCSTFCFRFTRDSGVLSEIACGVEKLSSGDFTSEIRSQVIGSSFAVGSEFRRNYCSGSFFNSHA
jgi:hypothetical protein